MYNGQVFCTITGIDARRIYKHLEAFPELQRGHVRGAMHVCLSGHLAMR